MLAAASGSFGDLPPGWAVTSELQLLSSSLAAALLNEFTGVEPDLKLKTHRDWQLTEIGPCGLDFPLT